MPCSEYRSELQLTAVSRPSPLPLGERRCLRAGAYPALGYPVNELGYVVVD
jgi:hypothetical protein